MSPLLFDLASYVLDILINNALENVLIKGILGGEENKGVNML